ncbi:TIGR02300 family protein [Pseudoroseomonas rhizosphaerae]|uniref:TIGR02300 family protein n=1 Tax=Teichococcus rhizosphaerae TaxID=1335062 RepID=A0A2C7A4P4_9PROT|nr:TIGR02300 family protein [Pseudoroseomonas rhizosphaerae]PHK95038.1 TIGR02300 family protein [Pseudoroseomonas rhizosphaerae]
MAKPELGLKRTCVACGAKFYDLTRQPAVCPKCGTEQPAEQPRLRRAAAVVEEKVKKRPVPVEADGDDVEIEDVDADDAIDDGEDLDDAEDDLDGEIEVETDREEEN